jgi:RNA polymerase sigma-70 factor (ECF subfamily)
VLRTALILCGGNAAEADDLTQDTMLKAYRAIDRFEPGTDARAWLLAILRNARVDRIRAAAAARGAEVSLSGMAQEPADPPQTQELDPEIAAQNPQAVLEQLSDRELIDALQSLPEEIRWTLLLVDVQGMDHADAAAALGVPVGTVKSRAHRGRAMLRTALMPVARLRGLVRDRE